MGKLLLHYLSLADIQAFDIMGATAHKVIHEGEVNTSPVQDLNTLWLSSSV